MLLSLITYQLSDPGWSHASRAGAEVANAGGQVGAYLADTLYFAFGYLAYLLPLALVYGAWVILKDYRALHSFDKTVLLLRGVGLLLMIAGGCVY